MCKFRNSIGNNFECFKCVEYKCGLGFAFLCNVYGLTVRIEPIARLIYDHVIKQPPARLKNELACLKVIVFKIPRFR